MFVWNFVPLISSKDPFEEEKEKKNRRNYNVAAVFLQEGIGVHLSILQLHEEASCPAACAHLLWIISSRSVPRTEPELLHLDLKR